MPAIISASEQERLWTAEEFLEWLKPGVHADLINGEIFLHSPVNLKLPAVSAALMEMHAV